MAEYSSDFEWLFDVDVVKVEKFETTQKYIFLEKSIFGDDDVSGIKTIPAFNGSVLFMLAKYEDIGKAQTDLVKSEQFNDEKSNDVINSNPIIELLKCDESFESVLHETASLELIKEENQMGEPNERPSKLSELIKMVTDLAEEVKIIKTELSKACDKANPPVKEEKIKKEDHQTDESEKQDLVKAQSEIVDLLKTEINELKGLVKSQATEIEKLTHSVGSVAPVGDSETVLSKGDKGQNQSVFKGVF